MRHPGIINRIRDAFDRCAVHQDTTREAFVAVVHVTSDHAEQVHHGTTDYALAAWHQWAESRRDHVRVARGVTDYLVPDMDGRRTIAGPALVLETVGGETLALTGCTWGYGGEGPHGSALVLVDAGFFDTLEKARAVVAGQDGGAAWKLERTGGT